jgi:hypothetical protein
MHDNFWYISNGDHVQPKHDANKSAISWNAPKHREQGDAYSAPGWSCWAPLVYPQRNLVVVLDFSILFNSDELWCVLSWTNWFVTII